MRRWLRQAWQWSWLVTVPTSLVFFAWSYSVGTRFATFGVRYSTDPHFALLDVGRMEFEHYVREFFAAVAPVAAEQAPPIAQIHLFVPEAEIRRLDSNLPHSGLTFVRGRVLNNGRLSKVKIRYRGDTYYHWAYYKKSFRLKMKRGETLLGMRSLNLLVPKHRELLNNNLSYRLAHELGVLSPRSEMVEVYMNGRRLGVYVMVEQLGEEMLRRNSVLPGDVYVGELIAKDHHNGVDSFIFKHPGLWGKAAHNNHFDVHAIAPLKDLTSLLAQPQTEAVQRDLLKLIDVDAFARFHAAEVLMGTLHIDAVHNWRLYFDPGKGRFFPIMWDPVGWNPDWQHIEISDVITTPLHLALHRNAEFLRARYRVLDDFYKSGKAERFLSEARELLAQMQAPVARDPNLVDDLKSLSPQEARGGMEALYNSIKKQFELVKKTHVDRERSRVGFEFTEGILKLSVEGEVPIARLLLTFSERVPDSLAAEFIFKSKEGTRSVRASQIQKVSDRTIELDAPFIANYQTKMVTFDPNEIWRNRVDVSPGYYEVKFSPFFNRHSLNSLKAIDFAGEPIRTEAISQIRERPLKRLYAIFEESCEQSETWSGEKLISGVLEARCPVTIVPGTKIRLQAGAAIFFYNRVIAEGTREKPITFFPAREGQNPWGAVILKGKAASGSRFDFCEFGWGSGYKTDLLEFSAMLSIHDADNVTISRCKFHDSQIVDDMVHVVYSEVHFIDSLFQNSHSDAVDVDIGSVDFLRCQFENSGNDSIDLMTTKAVVVDSEFRGSLDKGISVGEDSTVLAVNSRFRENSVGVQAKDGSHAALVNVLFESNKRAVDAYMKNWHYEDGGHIVIGKAVFSDNGSTFSADDHSSILASDSYVDHVPVLEGTSGSGTISVDSENREKAREADLSEEVRGDLRVRAIGPEAWRRIDPKRRGIRPVECRDETQLCPF